MNPQHTSADSDASTKSLSTAIHEINNPLEALTNLLYLIQQDAHLSDETKMHLQMAERELRRIAQIAEDAMRETREEAKVETDIAELLVSVLELYRSQCEDKNIAVQTRLCRNSRIVAQPNKIRQVFTNLLLNSIEAMPEGGKILARTASAHEKTGDQRRGLRVTFADNGHGIRPESLSRIFEPHFSTKGNAGHGMGLSVVRDIVNRHEGGLKVRSSARPGRTGTVFSLFFPSNAARA